MELPKEAAIETIRRLPDGCSPDKKCAIAPKCPQIFANRAGMHYSESCIEWSHRFVNSWPSSMENPSGPRSESIEACRVVSLEEESDRT